MCAAVTAACARTLRAATGRATSAGCNTPFFSSRRALLGHCSRRHMAAAVQSVREVYDVMETYDLVTKKGYTYLDVRSKEEFANGHAPSSINIPLLNMGPAGMEPNPNFVEEVKAKFDDPEEKLVVACQAGNRSTRACAVLQDSYVDLVNSKPGWAGWLAAGLPVEK